jgi:cell division protein FtsW
MFVKHMWHMAAGMAALAFYARLDYQKMRISVVAVGMLLITLIVLVLVLVFGIDRGLRAGSYQPSELAKLVIIIYLAVWLASKKETLRDFWHGMAPFAVVVGLVAGLIVLQPDISAAATVLVIGGLMFFLAGADMLQLGGALVIAALAGRIVIQFYATGQQRIEEYIAGLRDITEGSWHVLQATVAFVDGGIFGVGLGAGNGKFAYLPVPHTDSVFAVVGEELGLVGSLALVALFVMLSWRGMRIAAHADDTFGQLLAGGLTGWIALEVLINVGVILGVLPFAGNALPLISYGGSSLVVMLAAIGILLSVSRHDPDDRPDREKRANIDLRRWNRRARLSGTGGRR